MKHILALLLFLLIDFTICAQNVDRDKEMRETISWINKQFRDHAARQNYVFKEIVYVNNEPIMNVLKSPGTCTSEDEIEQIPIKKIKPIRFAEALSPVHQYYIYFETKNGEKIIWYRNEEDGCGQIGDYTFLYLNDSIEQNNLMNRLKDAFLYLMKLYGNDGKEKF